VLDQGISAEKAKTAGSYFHQPPKSLFSESDTQQSPQQDAQISAPVSPIAIVLAVQALKTMVVVEWKRREDRCLECTSAVAATACYGRPCILQVAQRCYTKADQWSESLRLLALILGLNVDGSSLLTVHAVNT